MTYNFFGILIIYVVYILFVHLLITFSLSYFNYSTDYFTPISVFLYFIAHGLFAFLLYNKKHVMEFFKDIMDTIFI